MDSSLTAHFDQNRVRRGNRVLLLTAVVLAVVTAMGAILQAAFDASDFATTFYLCGLTGLVGFGTNWLAIKMLFHPYKPIFGIQGVIPRKRKDLARKAAEVLEERLISGHHLSRWVQESGSLDGLGKGLRDQLRTMLTQPALRESAKDATIDALVALMPSLLTKLTATVEEKVKENAGPFAGFALPMVSKISASLSERLTKRETIAAFVNESGFEPAEKLGEILDRPEAIAAIQTGIGDSIERMFASLNVRGLLESELNKQSEAELEALINDATADQLVFLQVAGGILGVIAGLVMQWPLLLLALALLGGVGFAVARLRSQATTNPSPSA